MSLDKIKKELASVINTLKKRLEIEKGFGIDTITLSKPAKVINPPSPKSPAESKPIENPCAVKPINEQTNITRGEANNHLPAMMAEPFGDQTFKNEKERRDLLLEELRQKMLACHKCPLGKTRTNLVFGVGNPMADLMFVGEAP